MPGKAFRAERKLSLRLGGKSGWRGGLVAPERVNLLLTEVLAAGIVWVGPDLWFFLTNFSTAGGLNMIATYPAIQYVGKKAYLMSKSGHESVKHCGEVP